MSVLCFPTAAGLNSAVTPFGTPDADSVRLPLKPFREFTVMIVELSPPESRTTLLGETERLKPGVACVVCDVKMLRGPHPIPRVTQQRQTATLSKRADGKAAE